VAVGAKAIKTIYGATRADDDDIPTFSTYWRTNARDAIYGAGILCLLYYVLIGGPVTVSGLGLAVGSALLLLFVTGGDNPGAQRGDIRRD